MANKIKGTSGDDSLTGTSDDDEIDGRAGDDTLVGGAGDDTLRGQAGDDSLVGGDGDDELDGGSQDDTLEGGAGDDTLSGGSGEDSLSGGDGDDELEGGSQNDTLSGGAGDDELDGDSGDDSLYGDDGNDELDGGAGDDGLSGGDGDDTLDGDSGADTLSGGDGDDELDGGAGDDAIFGGAGDDTLIGDHGSDVMDGGAGDDFLEMGGYDGGNDTVAFGPGSGHDTAMDWSPDDDFIHIGDVDPDDLILTATADPQIWVLTINGAPGNSLTLDFTYHWDTSLDVSDILAQVLTNDDTLLPTDPFDTPICLTSGARIDTPGGPRPVETLRVGDLVITRDAGPQPIRAHLHKRASAAAMAANPALCPVEIAAGAFGDGLPLSPMRVSLQHAFLAYDGRPSGKGEVLIRARHLAEELGCATICDAPDASVTYHHLLLDRHHLIRAEGVWTETIFTGPGALASDPLLAEMMRGQPPVRMQDRARRLILRKHLRRFRGFALGRGVPEADRRRA